MRKEIKIVSVGICTFVLGLSLSGMAISAASNSNIAVVDVQKVVASSAQVKALKDEQQAKVNDVQAFVEEAKKSVAAETDKTKSKALEDKYNKELQQKTADIQKEYAKKLQAIDKSISETIKKEAVAQSYDIVLSKGVVLYGGTDITGNIIKATK